ncbi:enoyl-CoA hydratase-related protein [Streptomyces ipomoeae]|uniref:enoyl-CoA hydratase-related protein n=1 Tax=Streptomyces ipomoeae TaxID=103232 RepID=UPI0011477BFC|nr:enoyl-CoA hydratase-related protein [Streptomyces ipomoeae]MDX2937648.1 enoyl-CoA hydratase-related protein [Streptomyces ipomoeae]TQE22793.1 enoyl-CoA hydratase [Streptomyces ipomoeae]
MGTYQQVGYAVADRVATITLDRVEARNGYTVRMAQELRHAFGRADADDDVRAVVLTGAGRDFCVGADLSGRSFDVTGEGGDDLPPLGLEPAGWVSSRMLTMNKPVIAALNGAAVGAGATVPLAADFRLAATTAKFAFPFTRRGIVAEGGSTWLLPRLVGLPKALDWMISGRVFGAQEALDAGLLHSVHEPDALLAASYDLAAGIITHAAPVAVAITRQMLYRMSPLDSPLRAHELETQLVADLVHRPDATEGVASFFEKRAPEFPTAVSDGLPEFLPWVGEE